MNYYCLQRQQYRTPDVFELKREVRAVSEQITQAPVRVDSDENCRICVWIGTYMASQTKLVMRKIKRLFSFSLFFQLTDNLIWQGFDISHGAC